MSSQKDNGMAFEWAIGAELARQTGSSIIENAFSNVPKNSFEAVIADSRRYSFIV